MRVSCNETRDQVTCFLASIFALIMGCFAVSWWGTGRPSLADDLVAAFVLLGLVVIVNRLYCDRRSYTVEQGVLVHWRRGRAVFSMNLRDCNIDIRSASIRLSGKTLYFLPRGGRSFRILCRLIERSA